MCRLEFLRGPGREEAARDRRLAASVEDFEGGGVRLCGEHEECC